MKNLIQMACRAGRRKRVDSSPKSGHPKRGLLEGGRRGSLDLQMDLFDRQISQIGVGLFNDLPFQKGELLHPNRRCDVKNECVTADGVRGAVSGNQGPDGLFPMLL